MNFVVLKRCLNFSLYIFIVTSPEVSLAGRECKLFFSSQDKSENFFKDLSRDIFYELSNDALLNPNPKFLDFHQKHKNKYNLNKNLVRTKVKKQCFSTCWINSFLTLTESRASMVYKNPVQLSDLFLLRKHLETVALKALETSSSFSEISLIRASGTVEDALYLAKRYGLVTVKDFKSNVDFSLNKISFDRFLMSYKIFLNRLKRSGLAESERAKYISQWLDNTLGRVPLEISVADKKMSPKEFYNSLGIPAQFSKLPSRPSEALDTILYELRSGRPVFVSLKWTRELIEADIGFASVEAFSVYKNNSRLSEFVGTSKNHALLIVNYETKDGKLIKLLAQNTHGETAGEKGFIHIYKDYFEAFYFRGFSVY